MKTQGTCTFSFSLLSFSHFHFFLSCYLPQGREMHFSIVTFPSARRHDACAFYSIFFFSLSFFSLSFLPSSSILAHSLSSCLSLFYLFMLFYIFPISLFFRLFFPSHSFSFLLRSLKISLSSPWSRESECEWKTFLREPLFPPPLDHVFLHTFYPSSLTSPSVFLNVFLSLFERSFEARVFCVCVRFFWRWLPSSRTPHLLSPSTPHSIHRKTHDDVDDTGEEWGRSVFGMYLLLLVARIWS